MAEVKKEIALKVTTDVKQTEKAFGSATEELRKTQKALVEMALAGKQGSAEFKQMEQRAGQLRDAIGDVNRRVNNLASDTPKLQILGEAATAVAGGFAVAQGAAALFGDENEDVQKAILKTQGAMTLLNGVQSAANALNKDSALMMSVQATAQKLLQTELVKSALALRGWGLALAATGIGAAVVALGLLVAAFKRSTEESDRLAKSLENQKVQQETLRREIELTTKARQLEINILKALGANEKQVALERLRLLSDQIDAQQKTIDKEKENIASLAGFQDQSVANRRKQILKEKEFALEQLRLQVLDQLNIIRTFEQANTREAIESTRFRAASINAIGVEITAAAQKEQDERLRAVLEANRKEFNDRKETEIRTAEMRAFYASVQKQDQERLQQGIVDTTTSGLQAIADLSAFFAGKDEARQRKAFEIQKKVNIATTIIDSLVSAQKIFKSTSDIPVVGAILAPIAAASALAAGLARVAAIRNTSFGAASAGPVAGIRQAGMPSANVAVPQGFNPNQTPTGGGQVPPNGNSNGMGAQRVFVLERDIRNVGQRVNAAERFATFG